MTVEEKPAKISVEHRDDQHVVPLSGPEHEASSHCWCHPEPTFQAEPGGPRVWTHRLMS